MSCSSSSDGVEGEVADTLFSAIDQAVAMLKEEMKASSKKRMWLHQRYINHDREAAHERLHRDYFTDDCVYPPDYFRRK
jgi:hypothetical protein